MFLEEHIDEMIENLKESLVIYKDLNAIPFNDMVFVIEEVLAVIRSDKYDEEGAKKYLMDKLEFSEQTVSFLLNMSLSELLHLRLWVMSGNIISIKKRLIVSQHLQRS